MRADGANSVDRSYLYRRSHNDRSNETDAKISKIALVVLFTLFSVLCISWPLGLLLPFVAVYLAGFQKTTMTVPQPFYTDHAYRRSTTPPPSFRYSERYSEARNYHQTHSSRDPSPPPYEGREATDRPEETNRPRAYMPPKERSLFQQGLRTLGII